MFLSNKKKLVLLVVLLASIASLIAQAQSSRRKFRIPYARSKPLLNANGEPLVVSVATDGLESKNGEPLFLWSYQYVYKQNDTHYYLGIPKEDSLDFRLGIRLGWFSKNHLLDSPYALRTEKKIYRKIIIFDNKYEQRIPIYTSPSENAEKILNAPLFSFFYIYKEDKDFYLIGVSPVVDLASPSADILGWIGKKSCREWNTREAVNHNSRTRRLRLMLEEQGQRGMTRIYKTLKDAVDRVESNVIAKEFHDTVWHYNTPRYPLLQSQTIDGKRLFEVAFLGGSGRDAVQRVISLINEHKRKIGIIDIMLVIDASIRDQTRKHITLAIKNILQKLQQQQRQKKQGSVLLDLALGVTFYDDFRKGIVYKYRRGKLFQPRVVHLFSINKDIRKFERAMKRAIVHKSENEPKSLWYAIDSALHKRARWRKNSSRYMIVLGRGGNHLANSPHDISKLSLQDMQQTLSEKRIRLYAMQYFVNADKLQLQAYREFYRQITQLTTALKAGGYIPIFPQTSSKNDEWENLFSLLIMQKKQEAEVLHRAITSVERGFPLAEAIARHRPQWNSIWQQLHRNIEQQQSVQDFAVKIIAPDLSKLIDQFFALQKIDIGKLDPSENETFYDSGWVWEFHPEHNIEQIQVCLLIDKLELSRLVGFLYSLALELKQASRPEQYIEIWKTLLKTTFGIDHIGHAEPIDTLISQHTGLPFMNGVLNYTLDDFVKKSRTPAFRNEIINRLDRTYGNLFNILLEKELITVRDVDGTVRPQTKKRWWSEKDNETKYAWIEIERFP